MVEIVTLSGTASNGTIITLDVGVTLPIVVRNHVTNGDCDPAGGGWNFGGNFAGSYGSQGIEFDTSQDITWEAINDLVPGQRYRAACDWSYVEQEEGRGGQLLIYFFGTGLGQIPVGAPGGSGTFEHVFTATGTGGIAETTGLRFMTDGSGITGSINHIVIEEVVE